MMVLYHADGVKRRKRPVFPWALRYPMSRLSTTAT